MRLLECNLGDTDLSMGSGEQNRCGREDTATCQRIYQLMLRLSTNITKTTTGEDVSLQVLKLEGYFGYLCIQRQETLVVFSNSSPYSSLSTKFRQQAEKPCNQTDIPCCHLEEASPHRKTPGDGLFLEKGVLWGGAKCHREARQRTETLARRSLNP